MPKFVAIHDIGPGLREIFAEKWSDMVPAMKQMYPQVVWDGVYVEWETGKAVCLWEAPDAESIINTLDELGFPYEDVFPVEWVTPHDIGAEA